MSKKESPERLIFVKHIGIVKTFPETIDGVRELLAYMRTQKHRKLCVVYPPDSRFSQFTFPDWEDEYISIQNLIKGE